MFLRVSQITVSLVVASCRFWEGAPFITNQNTEKVMFLDVQYSTVMHLCYEAGYTSKISRLSLLRWLGGVSNFYRASFG